MTVGYNEIIALGIVGMAVFFLIRRLIVKKSKNSCCGKKCAVSSKDSIKSGSDCEKK
jgi:hypothetical protein